MLNFIKGFRAKEEGAATVDWVVLVAVLVGLALVIGSFMGSGTSLLGGRISSHNAAQNNATY